MSGGFFELTSAVNATSGTYSMKVYSTIALDYVELKLEDAAVADNNTIMTSTHSGSGWQTLTLKSVNPP